MDKDQIYMYNRQEVKFHHEIQGLPEWVVVLDSGGYGEWIVARKTDLVKLEDSYEYKHAQERADKIRLITAKAQENLDELAEKVVDKAIKSLAHRVKFNVAFGEGGSSAPYAIMIATELEKMIRESGKKIAGKGDIDL